MDASAEKDMRVLSRRDVFSANAIRNQYFRHAP
jgi:hypothetical protein